MQSDNETILVDFISYPGLGGATAIVPNNWAGKKVKFFFDGKLWGEDRPVYAVHMRELGLTVVRMASMARENVKMSLIE